jgi:hypothetical protein
MFKNMYRNADKAGMSLPESRQVCGYEIKKMPIAPYLKAVTRLSNLPDDFIKNCFPGKSPSDVLETLTKINENGLAELVGGALMFAPAYIIDLVSDITDISRDDLLNDDNIGLAGILEIITAFIEVNRLGECAFLVQELKKRITTLTKRI